MAISHVPRYLKRVNNQQAIKCLRVTLAHLWATVCLLGIRRVGLDYLDALIQSFIKQIFIACY